MVKKNKAAAALGKKGGKAGTGKAKARTAEQARAAANARWKKPTEAGGQSPCCNKWIEHTTYKAGGADIDKMADGTWSVAGDSQSYVLYGIKFCPWCGKQTLGKTQ